MTTSGQKKLFHAYRNVNVASVASCGTVAGTIMRSRICQREAPSMKAASSISFGMVIKACRMRNVPYAVKIHGMISEATRSTQPMATIS